MKTQTEFVESRRRTLVLLGGIVCGAGLVARRALAGEARAMPANAGPRRSEILCNVPRLNLLRQDGSLASFPEELDDGWPIVLSFFSTTCAACRTNNEILSEMLGRLGAEAAKVRLLSISVDPQHDTPERLAHYARQIHAPGQWQFYSGSQDNLAAFQSAFNACQCGDPNHLPTTFLRGAPCVKWVRLDGVAGAEALVREYETLRKVRSFL